MRTLKIALAAACAVVVGWAFTASAATCTYTGSWDATPTSAEDEIVIESGTLTWEATLPQTVASWTQNGGTVTFKTGRSDNANTIGVEEGDERVFKVTGDVTINGGTVMHAAQPSLSSSSPEWIDGKGVYRLILKAGGDITVGADGVVSADNRGFLREQGLGQAGTAPSSDSCHGGTGAYGGESFVKCYGSVCRPESLGSGGCYSDAAGSGGGAVRLETAGTLTVNGTVSARATTTESYSASGGSVLLIGGTIAGSGIVNAAGANNTFRGGGDCGIIASKCEKEKR